ncbi:MAG: hypothetical protein V1886_04320 [archaeon]
MEIIGRISKGSRMDQIYLPKNRAGFGAGEYVLISPLESQIKEKEKLRPYFYNVRDLEPIKARIIEDILGLIGKKIDSENIIITGSFLEKGFGFNDIDILIISKKKIDTESINEEIQKLEGIKTHIIILDSKSLSSGLSSDPLYSLMLSKCVSKNRIILRVKRKMNYRLLDINLLKSKTLIDSYDMLNGNEKYYLTMNMVSILLFMLGKKLSKDIVNREIERMFNVKIKEIKENLLEKQDFLGRYKKIFNNTFNLILENIKKSKNEQKQIN